MNLFSLNSIRNMASPGEELYKLSGAPIDADTFIIQGSSDQSERLMDGENVTELTDFSVWHFADSNTWEFGISFQVNPDGNVAMSEPDEKTDSKFTEAVRATVVDFTNYQFIPDLSLDSIVSNLIPGYHLYTPTADPLTIDTYVIMAPSELRQLVLDDTPVPEQAQCIVFYYNLESKMWLDGMMLLFSTIYR